MNYIPITEPEKDEMLKTIGISSIEDLFQDIPEDLRLKEKDWKHMPKGLSEFETRQLLVHMASKNTDTNENISFLGAGAYNHFVPTIVDHLVSRSEFYTAYTPYQPEISQGTLQNIYEFQTMVCELFGLDVSNASVYDGATALAEAMTMACDRKKNEIIISEGVHPEYVQTANTYASGANQVIKMAALKDGITPFEAYEALATEKTAAYVVQYPNFFGSIEDVRAIAEATHARKALVIAVVTDVSAMGILEAPGNLGVDIAVGDGICFAGPLSLSGPNIGLIATTDKLGRKLPGRIAGVTEDAEGKKAYVLTMQAREQHIRRDKASSNICSNQALYALAFNITLSSLGKNGVKEIAENSLHNAHYAFEQLTKIPGVEPMFDQPFYCEFALKLPMKTKELQDKLVKKGFFAPVDLGHFDEKLDHVGLFFVNELRSKQQIDSLVNAMEVIFNAK